MNPLLVDRITEMSSRTEGESFRLRSYQAEMVEESLSANIIVVMDTGSGKTHIALARCAAELEVCRSDQIVWFLAPNVPLCEQQYETFKGNLPAFGIQILTGKDGVDHWSDQIIWDTVLENVRIVISTHQVLLDALTHGFVKMKKLALIIFDEAHHCVSNHPGKRIMEYFYMPLIGQHGHTLPKILGLSASPVMKARANELDLQIIEKNLAAIARSPKLHRSELIRFVHRPELCKVTYPLAPESITISPNLSRLIHVLVNYDLMTDPYVIDLFQERQSGHDRSRELQNVFMKDSTYCKQQLKSLVDKGKTMLEELGPSPTDWYLSQCIQRFEKTVQATDLDYNDWASKEKQHLLSIFRNLYAKFDHSSSISLAQISPKVETLIDVLVAEVDQDFIGLLFVEQRVWVATLAEIISTHPRTKDKFTVGTFVGTSTSTKRKANMAEFAEPRNQQTTLDDFRAGTINLIVATSVLEEGIDVSTCHLVICFERPKNLKSFVQRRGRARKEKSKYIILLPEIGNFRSPEEWENLEGEMKKAYLNDMRKVRAAEEREQTEEEGRFFYEIPSTGALLTMENALQHLHHFCSLLGSGPYVDTRPQFKLVENSSGRLIAEVILPISVDPALRMAQSKDSWGTERMAKKDAAFQAYKVLHQAGLVNDNLLPAHSEEDDEAAQFQLPEQTPSLIEASPPFDPWKLVAEQQAQSPSVYHRVLLTMKAPSEAPFHMVFAMSCAFQDVPEYVLHWNRTNYYSVVSSWLPGTVLAEDEVNTMREITEQILFSVFHSRMSTDRSDFLWLLTPSHSDGTLLTIAQLRQWHIETMGSQKANDLIIHKSHALQQWGWVTSTGDQRHWMVQRVIEETLDSPGSGETVKRLEVIRAPKRRDFLHPIHRGDNMNEAYTKIETMDASDCIVDNLPLPYSIFAMFVPSIIHKFEVYMVVDTLRTTILQPLSFATSDLPLLFQAVTSSSTGEEANYQRLEFLGDCILKLITSVHLMAAHPQWPESYLSGKKGRLVSNGSLARATLKAGLDKFIITKRFTGAKWSPRYATDILNQRTPANPPQFSSKILADVVESLIGSSYLIGGLPKAFTCIETLLPLEPWTPIPSATTTLFAAAPTDFYPQTLATVETLLTYTFTKPLLLLEALTHGSYIGPHANVRSYERLEFLGDAVLDYIISTRLYAHTTPLSHDRMHGIRTAMVNASFLAFRMFETQVSTSITNKVTFEPETEYRALWQFLRYGAPQLRHARDAALRQHLQSRDRIIKALENDARYPWHLFALNDAPKFLSDIVESVIGAVYIDSQGDIEACDGVVRRLGILDSMERVLRDGVDCLHPKERLGHLAVERGVKYLKVERETEETGDGEKDGEGEKRGYRVQVRVGDVNVGGVVEGIKRLNAETMAAWEAVRILEEENDVLMGDGDVDVDLVDEIEEGEEEDEEAEDEWFDADEGGGIASSELK